MSENKTKDELEKSLNSKEKKDKNLKETQEKSEDKNLDKEEDILDVNSEEPIRELEILTTKEIVPPTLEKIVEKESPSLQKEVSQEKETRKDNLQGEYVTGQETKDERNYNPKILDSEIIGVFSKNAKEFSSFSKKDIDFRQASSLGEDYNTRREYKNDSHSERELLTAESVDNFENAQNKYKKFKFR